LSDRAARECDDGLRDRRRAIGWSIGRQRRYLLQLATGEPVDPAAFVSEREKWAVGDTFVAGGRAFRILEIANHNVAEVTAHMFTGIWTVEELPPG
jgi:hypothetical protein